MTGPPARVLELLGLRPRTVTALRDMPSGNGNWLVGLPDGRRLVLRRHRPGTTEQDLSYEHPVLRFLPHRHGHLADGSRAQDGRV